MAQSRLRWTNTQFISFHLLPVVQDCAILTLLINPFMPDFTIVIFIHYKARIAVAIPDL